MLTLGQSDRFANHKAGTWQLISVNVNRGTSADVNEIVIRLLKLQCARTHLPVVFVLQETRSWDVPNPKLHGYACFGSQFGLATLVVSDRFFKIENRGEMYSSSLRTSSLSWPCMRQTVGKTWMYMRHSSRMSPKCRSQDFLHRG